jgi:EAL and modified HD-GYP domain-containing signal transduction protein
MNDTEHSAETASDENSTVLLARQAIYDRDLKVVGYEILFRDSDENRAEIDQSDPAAANAATARALINTTLDMDLDRIAEGKILFFNLSRDFLHSDFELPESESQIGIDVLTGEGDDESLAGELEDLALSGYVIALDDFQWRDGVEPLLEAAQMVKIDVQAHGSVELATLIERLEPFDVKLTAKKIEDTQQFDYCRELGFDLFQGFFMCKPTIVKAGRVPDSKVNVLRLMAKLQDPDVAPQELEAIIRHDMALNYRLLRTVNSAYYGLSVKIRSISHAIVYLGLPAIRRWTRLQLLAGASDSPSELIKLGLTRARMAELLTANLDKGVQDSAFTVGLFSLLDAILDLPMDQVVQQLPLEADLEAALTSRTGPYGHMLETIIQYENGQWDEMASGLYSHKNLSSSYMEALLWAQDQFDMLSDSDSD